MEALLKAHEGDVEAFEDHGKKKVEYFCSLFIAPSVVCYRASHGSTDAFTQITRYWARSSS